MLLWPFVKRAMRFNAPACEVKYPNADEAEITFRIAVTRFGE